MFAGLGSDVCSGTVNYIMMEKIRWGIIGCGDVCEKKSGPAFYKIEHSALEAVMRRDEAKVKDFARRHHVLKYYTNAQDIISDPDIDAVYVATPPNTHKEYSIKAMCGGKSVYVEKPMAMNYKECLEMITVSKETGQKLFPAFYRRALPYFLKIKSLLEEKRIGKVLLVNIRHYKVPESTDFVPDKHSWRVNRQIAGEGYFYDLAPHTLDILDFLLGEIEDAKGYSANLVGLYDAKDTFTASFRFKSGVLGSGQWCFVVSTDMEQDVVELVGTEGRICFSIFSFVPVRLETVSGTEYFEFASPEHIEQPLIQTVVDELRGVGHSLSTAESGARTARVMDLILKGDMKK